MDEIREKLSGKRLMNVDGHGELWFVPKPAIDEIVVKKAIASIAQATKLPIDEEDRVFAASLREGLVHKIYTTAKITFAISCYVEPHCLRHIVKLIQHGDTKLSKIDRRLPFSEKRLQECGFDSHNANAFFKAQMHFIAPRIQLGTVAPSEYRPDVILPLLAVEAHDMPLLDPGSFGKVTKVRVAPGHQVEPIHNGPLVRKQFKPEKKEDHYSKNEFLKELRNLAIISSARHDNIVRLLSAYVQGESFNFIFPLASHGNLSQLFSSDASLSWTDGVEVVMALSGLASALVTMHQFATEDLQLIGCHRDLKPTNILVDGRRLLLADFGLSRFVDSRERSTSTAPDLNDDFIAPEHEGKDFSLNRIGRSSDIWAFGCITLIFLVYSLRGKDGVEGLKKQRRTTWAKYAHHYFHNYDRPNVGLEEFFKHLTSEPSASTQGLLYLVKKMLLLQKDERLKATEIDAHMRSLSIHLRSATIEEEFDKACRGGYISVNFEMARFRGWHAALIKWSIIKDNEYDFPEFRGNHAGASYSDFQNVVEHLQELRKMLLGFQNDDLGRGRKALLPVSSRIDRLWGTLDENEREYAVAYSEDIMLRTNDPGVLRDLPTFLKQASHKRTEAKAIVKRQVLQPSSSIDLHVHFSCLKPKPSRDNVARTWIVTEDVPEPDLTLAEETRSRRWLHKDVTPSIYAKQTSSRLQELSNRLTRSADNKIFRVLRCRGYYCCSRERRSGLLYKLPKSKNGNDQIMLTLHKMLNKENSGSTAWFLGDRFRLAHSLANAIYELHTVSWLHRNLSASNVVFFVEQEEDIIDPLSFYMIGFAQSRADEDLTYTDGPTSTGDADEYYEHPEHVSESEGYQVQHDYYALGMLLLEIGLWKRLPDAIHNWPSVGNKRNIIMRDIVPRLGALMGTNYRDAVLACLDDKWEEWSMQRRQEIPMLFRTVVVERLNSSHCRA